MSRLYHYLDFEIAMVGLVTEGQIEVHLGLEVRRGVQVHHWDQTRQNKVEQISGDILFYVLLRVWGKVVDLRPELSIILSYSDSEGQISFCLVKSFFLPFYREFSTLSTLMDGIFQIKTEGAFPVNILSISPLSIYIMSYVVVTPLSLSISRTNFAYKQNLSLSL